MVYERRPLPGNNANIVSVTLLFLALAGGGFYGLLSALETGDGRWVALLLTCAAGVVVAGWRVRQHDERAFVEQERTRPQTFTQPEPAQPIHVYTKLSTGGNQTAVGRFTFTVAQWHALRQAIAKGGGKLLRDPIRAARPYIFERTDLDNWRSILDEFKRLGLIDDNSLLTNAGHAFFDADPFAPPSPPAAYP